MNYDKEILDRVIHETENAKIRLEAEAENRRREIYSAIPRIAEIDAELKSSVFEIIRASFGKGIDSKALIAKTRERNLELNREREELLKASGFPADFTEPRYACSVCDDTGIHGGELCPCIIEKYKKALALEINKDLRLGESDFSKFDISLYPETGKPPARAQMKEVLAFCKSWAEDFGEGAESLYMCGKSGLGKTFLASCIAAKVASLGYSVVFDTAFSILGTYEDVKFGRSEKNLDVFETADLLIIDDLGCEMSTPFAVAAFYNLINKRRSLGKSTIAITPLSKTEISKRYGSQVVSRLEGDFIKLEFLGDDVRLKR